MADRFSPARIEDPRLAVGVATTTDLCRQAQRTHGLAPTSTVALGRLLTAAALAGQIQSRSGTTSLQVVCEGRLRLLVAEINQAGHLRGFVRNKQLNLPQMAEGGVERRRAIKLGVGDGILAVTREPEGERFTQSTTPITSGEIDQDVDHFLNVSDQIPTAMACDILLDDEGAVVRSAGVIFQAMPDADPDCLHDIREAIAAGRFTAAVWDAEDDPDALLRPLAPEARWVDGEIDLSWRCRCSYDRVLGALQLLDADELADMVREGEPASVGCDFCGARYEVSPEEVMHVFMRGAHAEG